MPALSKQNNRRDSRAAIRSTGLSFAVPGESLQRIATLENPLMPFPDLLRHGVDDGRDEAGETSMP